MFRLLILLCATTSAFGALPKGWKACKKSDAKYSDCLSKEIENAVKSLVNGDKSLNVQPLDPLRISKLSLYQGNGPVSIDLDLRDVDVYGIRNIQIKQIKNDWKTGNIKIYIPKLTSIGKYKIDGKIQILPITGEGNGNLTCEELSVDADIKWKRIKKGTTEYFNIESMTVPLAPKRMYFHLENLFNGNKALGDQINSFLNENWQALLDELGGTISDALSMILIQIANQVLNNIPANEIDK